ncbi:MAG: molybdopterin cofactor-binding domain-containing protein [Bacteroidota bacterium]
MDRRTFIISTAAVASGVAVAGYFLVRPEEIDNPLYAILKDGQVAVTPYVIIDDAGITIITPRAEMGQGIQSTLAALVAEELDVPVTEVSVAYGPASIVYTNNIMYPEEAIRKQLIRRVSNRLNLSYYPPRLSQSTGAQTSLSDGFVKMRQAGASARTILIQAAGKKYNMNPSDLKTEDGYVILTDGRRIPYTSLAADAAKIPPPKEVTLKPRSEWKQLGKSQPRKDMPLKCTGTAQYAIDLQLPGMVYGTVKFNPSIGGGIKSFDDSEAQGMKGFIKTLEWDDGIIVLATNTWYAMEAAKAIKVEWGAPPYPMKMEEHYAAVDNALGQGEPTEVRSQGDIEAAMEGLNTFERKYSVPYLTHATMEPMNAVALLKDGELDIWAANQNPLGVRYFGSKIVGIPEESVRVHSMFMGGAFGRRQETDFIEAALRAAMAVEGKPVKVTWTREGDMSHGVYRPIASAAFKGAVKNGKPVVFDLQISAPALFASSDRRWFQNKGKEIAERMDRSVWLGMNDQPYNLPNYRIRAYKALKLLLPVGWTRGVGETQNVFFHETAMDELALEGGLDPMEMRLSLIDDADSRAVLEAVKRMSNWGSTLPEGYARGLAFARSSGAPTAQVVEIRQTEEGIRIEKVFVAVDVGIALDPRNIEAQIKSGVIYGLDSGINSTITVSEGKIEQRNFNNYPLLRIQQIPEIQVHIHENNKEILGVGESGVAANPPALGNAIFALTGKRIRNLPFRKAIKFA